MDRSKITTNDIPTAYMDSTFLVEGREEMLHEVRESFPDETKSEAEKMAEQIYSEDSQEGISTADAFNPDNPDL